MTGKNTGDIAIQVSHPDWLRIPFGDEVPILPVSFSTKMDLSTRELVKELRSINKVDSVDPRLRKFVAMACDELETSDAAYTHLFNDFVNMRHERNDLRKRLDAIMELIHDHVSPNLTVLDPISAKVELK